MEQLPSPLFKGEGVNDIVPHWFYEEGFPWTINPSLSKYSKKNYKPPLVQPAITPTRKIIVRSDSSRIITKSEQPIRISKINAGQVKDGKNIVKLTAPDLNGHSKSIPVKINKIKGEKS